jgi:hypothetical protein
VTCLSLRTVEIPVAGGCGRSPIVLARLIARYDDNSGQAAPGAEDCRSGSQHSKKMAPLSRGAKS